MKKNYDYVKIRGIIGNIIFFMTLAFMKIFPISMFDENVQNYILIFLVIVMIMSIYYGSAYIIRDFKV